MSNRPSSIDRGYQHFIHCIATHPHPNPTERNAVDLYHGTGNTTTALATETATVTLQCSPGTLAFRPDLADAPGNATFFNGA